MLPCGTRKLVAESYDGRIRRDSKDHRQRQTPIVFDGTAKPMFCDTVRKDSRRTRRDAGKSSQSPISIYGKHWRRKFVRFRSCDIGERPRQFVPALDQDAKKGVADCGVSIERGLCSGYSMQRKAEGAALNKISPLHY